MLLDQLNARRPIHLQIAIATVLENYDRHNRKTPAGTSDAHWRHIFSHRSASDYEIKDFITQYKLHRSGNWNYVKLNEFVRECQFENDRIGEYLEEINHKKCFSAYSKLRFYVCDNQKYFIFDSLVLTSLKVRTGEKIKRKNFDKVVSDQFDLELTKDDFNSGVSTVASFVEELDTCFMKRYYFDKFLMAQGRWIKSQNRSK